MTIEQTKLEQARKIALDVYRETGDLKQASAKSGLNALSLFRYLTVKGSLTMRDRLNIGTSQTKLGAQAELEFKRLCPIAMSVNSDEKQHKSYDFILSNGQTIDIKASTIRGKKMWEFKIQRPYQNEKGADYYFLFALHGEKLSDGYTTYVMPTSITSDTKTLEISTKNADDHWISELKIEPDKVLDFFVEMCTIQPEAQTAAYKEIFLDDGKPHFDAEIASIKNSTKKITRIKNERKKHQHVA